MLEKFLGSQPKFRENPDRIPPFAVSDPAVEILDAMSVRFTARFDGPAGSEVIGRAWISDADGTLVDGETGPIGAGHEAEMRLTIPESKVQNGDLIACMRVEWPLFQTKHVIACTLVRGEIVHPPKGEPC